MQFASLISGVLLAATLAGGLSSLSPALAQDRPPDAHLAFSSASYGLLLGVSRGQGVLEFRGQRYPFTVSGLRVATLGAAKTEALGQAYGLRKLADFSGRYWATEGGLTVVQGGGHAVLRNDKGVTLYVQNLQSGFDLTLGGGGLDLVLRDPPPAPSSDYPVETSKRVESSGLPSLELISTPPRR